MFLVYSDSVNDEKTQTETTPVTMEIQCYELIGSNPVFQVRPIVERLFISYLLLQCLSLLDHNLSECRIVEFSRQL